jgi:hypothetical protein
MPDSIKTLRAFTEGIPGLKCSQGRKHNQGTANLSITELRWIEYLRIGKGATSDTRMFRLASQPASFIVQFIHLGRESLPVGLFETVPKNCQFRSIVSSLVELTDPSETDPIGVGAFGFKHLSRWILR